MGANATENVKPRIPIFMIGLLCLFPCRSQKLRTLTKALSPAFLRFGGTSQDFMVFNPQRSRQLVSGLTSGIDAVLKLILLQHKSGDKH